MDDILQAMKCQIKEALKFIVNKFNIKIVRMPSDRLGISLYANSEDDIYVNIGAGSFYHPRWINLDKDNDFYRHLQKKDRFISYDLCGDSPLPFNSNEVDIFYTSHTVEHIPDERVKKLFADVWRCLKPGGIFRVVCPDMEMQYRAFSFKDSSFWSQPSPWGTKLDSIEDRFLEHFATALVSKHSFSLSYPDAKMLSPAELRSLFEELSMDDFFNEVTSRIPQDINLLFPQGHCNWFSFEKLHNFLGDSGFQVVYKSGYGQSLNQKMRNITLFDSTSPELSLYVEAIKN